MLPFEVRDWQFGRFQYDADVKLSKVEVAGLDDVLANNVVLAVRILTDTIAGLPNDVRNRTVAWLNKPQHTRTLVESSEWLGLSLEHMSAFCVAMSMDEDQNLLKDGVVAWSRQGLSRSHDALMRIKAFCSRYAQISRGRVGGSAWTASRASQLLSDLSTRWFAAFDDVALPVVEEVFSAVVGEASKDGHADTVAETGAADEGTSGQKRRRDDEEQRGAMVDAAVHWASSNLKRVRTSAHWPSARAPVVAAMLRACLKDAGTSSDTDEAAGQELQAAMLSWAGPANICSVLKAVWQCHGPVEPTAFQALLDTAAEKVTTLEDMHGGDALRAAQEAQRKAEVESALAKADAEVLRSRVEALRSRAEATEAEAAKDREALARKLAQEKQWVGELQAKASALLACVTAPRPPADGSEDRGVAP